MLVTQFVSFIRSSVLADDANVQYDIEYGNISDTHIENVIKLLGLKLSPPVIDKVPDNQAYYLSLLVKREIYMTLSTKTAPLYSVQVDDTKINRQERFDHYFKLISLVDGQIQTEVSTGAGATIEVADVFLSSRYYSSRSYENSTLQSELTLGFTAVEIGSSFAEFSWNKFDLSGGRKFLKYDVYMNTGVVYDKYKAPDSGIVSVSSVINDNSIQVAAIENIHKTYCKATGLLPNTIYNFCLFFVDRYDKFVAQEIQIKTLGG